MDQFTDEKHYRIKEDVKLLDGTVRHVVVKKKFRTIGETTSVVICQDKKRYLIRIRYLGILHGVPQWEQVPSPISTYSR